jgi:hypothetical protein
MVLLEDHIIRREELHLHPDGRIAIREIDAAHQLEVLVALLIPTSVQKQLEQFSVAAVRQLRRIQGQVHIDAANVCGCLGRKEKVRHPATYDDDGVAEGGENLPDIDEHTTSGLDLSGRVLALESWLGAHLAPAHAGFSR